MDFDSIICGDCLDVLKQVPARAIDLVILDPPYWKVSNQRWDYKWRTEQDYVRWCALWLAEVARTIRFSGSLYVFGYLRNLFHLYPEFARLGFVFRQQLVIEKGMQAIGGRATKGYKMFPTVTEHLLFFVFDSKPFIREFLKQRQRELKLSAVQINKRLGVKANGGGMWSIYTGNNILAQVPTAENWRKLQEILQFSLPYEAIAPVFNIEMGITDVWRDIDFYQEKRYHPTQKPAKLLERIIKASSNPGGLVLDPFAGACSTAMVCRKLDRRFLCVEMENEYAQIGRDRLKSL